MSDLKTVEELLTLVEAEIDEVRNQIEPLHTKIGRLAEDRSALIEERDTLKLAATDALGTIDWPFLLEETGRGSRVRYHRMDTELHRLFGIGCSTYNPDTQQRVPRIALDRSNARSAVLTLDGIRLLLPHLKPNEDGYIRFDVFEHTLSRGGLSIHLDIKPDLSEFNVERNSFTERECKTLEEAIEYLRSHYWYEDSSRKDRGRGTDDEDY